MFTSLFLVCVALAVGTWARNVDGEDVQTRLTALFDMDMPKTDIVDALGTREVSNSASGCKCYHGCNCWGVDNKMRVEVDLMLDELNHSGHTMIVGKFTVGHSAPFEKIWKANEPQHFCEKVENKNYCFALEVDDDGRRDFLRGWIKMTSPKKMNIGQFKLPLMMSSDDVSEDSSDDVSTEEYIDY
ncbi:uncharacterized protein LOC128240077 [Mya arenaria]|uniref:uncharacterized protein LOC128240077 n=1 Tax=Mya arenaria TaxID=6604 RepID=UPI0022DEF952|nr:uncharacterized protein LOC128240077 [Mya arenaria]